MKRYYKLLLPLCLSVIYSCSDQNNAGTDEIPEDKIEVSGIETFMDKREQTRATSDYAVNYTTLDPTATLETRTDWLLDMQIYNGATPYNYGQATLEWDATDEIWIPQTGESLYFPNYTKQGVTAMLRPSTWSPASTISNDQNSKAKLLAQDILVQKDLPYSVINPTHTPSLKLRHGHSMLDFILNDVDYDQIEDVTVTIDNVIYTPYEVSGSEKIEFMVIMPLDKENPVVTVTTQDGAQYTQIIDIQNTNINTCYCATLQGIELILSTITVSDWDTGEAVSGDYTSVTTYPTFRGPAETTVRLFYDNGNYQDLNFNSRGEATAKPLGRTIIAIQTGAQPVSLDTYLVIRGMVVDLSTIISQL